MSTAKLKMPSVPLDCDKGSLPPPQPCFEHTMDTGQILKSKRRPHPSKSIRSTPGTTRACADHKLRKQPGHRWLQALSDTPIIKIHAFYPRTEKYVPMCFYWGKL